MNNRVKWWRYLLATGAFWGLSLFGGVIPMLWNELSPMFSRYMPGDLGYLILQVISNAIGCMIAVYSLNYITSNSAPVCGIVNCVIASTLLAVMIILGYTLNTFTLAHYISFGLMIAVYLWNIVAYTKRVKINRE